MFFFNFAFFIVIYIHLHTLIFLHVILRNNARFCNINYFFIAFFSFLIFDYEYLFAYYILLVQRKNLNILGSKILWFFLNFAFFSVIYVNLHTLIFLHVILRNNVGFCNINYLFIACISFLIFDYEYLFAYYILLVQRKNFNILGSKILCFFLILLFLVLFTSICIRFYFYM